MKIVFHGSNAANFRAGFETLLDATAGHVIVDVSDALDLPGERAHFETADVIVGIRLGPTEPLPRAVRLYQAPAAGTDAIDVARLPDGARLCNAFGHEYAIAEYVMTALLQRHVPLADADTKLRQGLWPYWAGQPGALRTELGDHSIGLLGYGHIGKAVAARARAFGMRVVVANRTRIDVGGLVDASYGLDQLSLFMTEADYVVVSVPLTDSTRGLVGKAALAHMRRDAVILNVGRGPVIDEQALFDSLQGRHIGGAVVDTWYQYPGGDAGAFHPSKLPFHALPNVVMTPHMSGWTAGTVRRRQQTIADNITRLMRGEPLLNIVK